MLTILRFRATLLQDAVCVVAIAFVCLSQQQNVETNKLLSILGIFYSFITCILG